MNIPEEEPAGARARGRVRVPEEVDTHEVRTAVTGEQLRTRARECVLRAPAVFVRELLPRHGNVALGSRERNRDGDERGGVDELLDILFF